MGTPLGPKFTRYTYMDTLGYIYMGIGSMHSQKAVDGNPTLLRAQPRDPKVSSVISALDSSSGLAFYSWQQPRGFQHSPFPLYPASS